MNTEIRQRRSVVEAFVFGIADDLRSTDWLLIVSRITHWACFLIAVGAALRFAHLYFTNGNLWSNEDVPNRQIFQVVFNESLWLFVAGISLLGAFIAWLNTDVLMNRKIMLEQQLVKETIVSEPTTVMPARMPVQAQDDITSAPPIVTEHAPREVVSQP